MILAFEKEKLFHVSCSKSEWSGELLALKYLQDVSEFNDFMRHLVIKWVIEQKIEVSVILMVTSNKFNNSSHSYGTVVKQRSPLKEINDNQSQNKKDVKVDRTAEKNRHRSRKRRKFH